MAKDVKAPQVQLIVGLGNPGAEYEQTRHNAGAMFVCELARMHGASLQADKKFFGDCARIRLNGQDVRLLIPNTFMNRSGQAVIALANFYKIPPEAILVAHDELDFDAGIAKLKMGGGHGGHNGLRDIISRLSGNKNFLRLRLGIGHPGSADKVSGFVLSKAPRKEQEMLDACIDQAAAVMPQAVDGELSKAMQALHSFKA